MTPTAAITTTMTDRSLVQLMTLLSPVFPVGGFAYSAGLETACSNETGSVRSKDDLKAWIETSLTMGWLRNDAILLAAAMRDGADLNEINDLALALSGSAERYEETNNLGTAFAKAAEPWTRDGGLELPQPCAYAVAVGAVAAQMQLDINQVLLAFLQASVSNQLQAALRLMSLGQQAAVTLQHELEPTLLTTADSAANGDLNDLGSFALATDMAAMNHETMTSRIFRS